MKKLLLSICLMIIAATGFSQTNISGGIYSNTVWTLANSPYIVTDTVVVFPGVKLTIEPGVVVKFENNKRLEIRQAKLIANGTATDSITFTSNAGSPTQGIWGNVFLNNSSISKFNYCNFRYADRGIYNDQTGSTNDTLIVKNSNFNYNNCGIYNWWLESTNKFDSCNFINNLDGFYTEYGTVQANVNSCNFLYNQHNGFSGSSAGGGDLNKCNALYNQNIGIKSAHSINNSSIENNQTGINGGLIKNSIVKNNTYGAYFVGNIDSSIIRNNQYGVYVSTDIMNSTVDSNSIVGIQYNYGNVSNCEIKNNGIGIDLTDSIYTVTKNIIENNNIGILLEASNHIFCNRICNNTSYDLKYTRSYNYSVANNYWCTTDSAIITSHIYDGYDNISLGLIHFLPLDTVQCYLYSCHALFNLYPDTAILHQYWAVNMASGVPPLSYLWEWGDGTNDTIALPSHTYSTAGYYNICLTITDSTGCSSTYCDSSYLAKNSDAMIYINVISTAGIIESQENESFLIYPNPAQDRVTITTTAPQRQKLISIYNIQGQQMMSATFNNQNTMQLDVSALSKGIYLVRIQNESGVVNKKLIVQ